LYSEGTELLYSCDTASTTATNHLKIVGFSNGDEMRKLWRVQTILIFCSAKLRPSKT